MKLNILIAAFLLPALPVSSAAATGQADGKVEARVDAILAQMTLEEKIDLLGGVDFFDLRGVPRLGVPRLTMADGPMGLRNNGPATAYGGGIALAATWNPELVERVGVEFGRDARAKGAHFLLAPGVNIYRASIAGRNFEYFGEDPYLAARLAVRYIEGVQSQGVSATIKHFVANNSDFDRNKTDSVVDERALREIYLPAFEAAVKEAGVGAIMDAYNLANGAYMSQNAYLNVDVAKREWGFRGVIMSDWISTYDAVAAANGGLDIEMPSGEHLNRRNLLPAIEDGVVSVATIDDKVRRILRLATRFGWLDREQQDLSIPRYNPEGRKVALDAAREGVVLLRNEASMLPLDRSNVESILVIGPTAHPAVMGGGGSSQVEPFTSTSILEGLVEVAGPHVTVLYNKGLPTLTEMVDATQFTTDAGGGESGIRAEYFATPDLSGEPVIERVDPRIAIRPATGYPEGTQSERWTGYFNVKEKGRFDVFVTSSGDGGGFYRLSIDGEVVFDQWALNKATVDYLTLELEAGNRKVVFEHRGRPKWPYYRLEVGISRYGDRIDPAAAAMAARADAIVVAAGFDSGTESEGSDRTFRLPPGQEELIETLAASGKPVAVVLTAGGAVDMRSWLENVSAVLTAWYPGQEGGAAVAEILFGDVNPSGRLPATFERDWRESPAFSDYYPEPGTNRIIYNDGVFVGYRGYEEKGIEPLFPFGHGLSYTSFEYANLDVSPATTTDGRVSVSFDLRNTGRRAGADVAQLYVADGHSPVERPPKELKGFAKVFLEPGEQERVTIELDRRSFAYYDVDAGDWAVSPGAFNILVGHSSTAIELRGAVRFD
jgi:beta-glucosidase